jgi:transcriptional regulator with GAF, ATPase, and Fis domain
MKEKAPFLEVVRFFQRPPAAIPGSPEYNAAFCQILLTATSADAASLWQVDTENQLHLISSTDIPQNQVTDISIRQGEGIGGAAVLSRQAVFVANAQKQTFHDPRVDERFGLRTYAMISAPVVFEDHLFGVINILNHRSEKHFPPEWKDWLSALAVMYGAALARAGRLTPYQVPSKMEVGVEGKSPQVSAGKTVIVGISQPVQEALHLCLKAGETDIPVLISGETGTGKELAARRIHEASPRAQGPFLGVNCAALSETLLESELFGHVKGAFTGATRDRQGKFVAASKGTLFLDEIGEMSLASQAKILRVLEEKKVTPLGSEKPVPFDTRMIAATNRNLTEMVKDKRLREDLYYRLCGLEIRMPPLRERVEDIPLLAIHFLNKASGSQKGKRLLERRLRLAPEALEMLVGFAWPGNVRQLEQALFAAAALCEGDEITPGNFPAWFHEAAASQAKQQTTYPSGSHPPDREPVPGKDHYFLKEEERKRYFEALQATKYPGTGRWNVSAAARQLGIPRETLTYHLKKMRLSK